MPVKNPYRLALVVVAAVVAAVGGITWLVSFDPAVADPGAVQAAGLVLLGIGFAVAIIWLAIGALTHERDAHNEHIAAADDSETGTPPGT